MEQNIVVHSSDLELAGGVVRTSRWARRSVAFCAVALLGLGAVACSSDSDSSGEQSAGGDTEEPTGTTVAEGPCPAATSLTIVDSDVVDGPIEVVSEFADVTLGETAGLVFTTYEFEEDPQFGMSAPVGVPDVPTGGTIVQFTLSGSDGELALVEYSSEASTSPRISFTSAYHGSERINPLRDHVIELTEVTAEQICGTIAPAGTASDIQTVPYIEGAFVVPVV